MRLHARVGVRLHFCACEWMGVPRCKKKKKAEEGLFGAQVAEVLTRQRRCVRRHFSQPASRFLLW